MPGTLATTTTRLTPAPMATAIRLTATPIQATATATVMAITVPITGAIGARAGASPAESIGAGIAGSRSKDARLGTKDLLGGGEFLTTEVDEIVGIVGRDGNVARVR